MLKLLGSFCEPAEARVLACAGLGALSASSSLSRKSSGEAPLAEKAAALWPEVVPAFQLRWRWSRRPCPSWCPFGFLSSKPHPLLGGCYGWEVLENPPNHPRDLFGHFPVCRRTSLFTFRRLRVEAGPFLGHLVGHLIPDEPLFVQVGEAIVPFLMGLNLCSPRFVCQLLLFHLLG